MWHGRDLQRKKDARIIRSTSLLVNLGQAIRIYRNLEIHEYGLCRRRFSIRSKDYPTRGMQPGCY